MILTYLSTSKVHVCQEVSISAGSFFSSQVPSCTGTKIQKGVANTLPRKQGAALPASDTRDRREKAVKKTGTIGTSNCCVLAKPDRNCPGGRSVQCRIYLPASARRVLAALILQNGEGHRLGGGRQSQGTDRVPSSLPSIEESRSYNPE
jgi:hypothetical protein